MTTHETLMRARAEVEAGWCRYLAEDSRGNVCAVGAIARACEHRSDIEDRNVEYLRAVVLVSDCVPVPGLSISSYNDLASTTKADVLALFDRAVNQLVPVGDPAHDFAVA